MFVLCLYYGYYRSMPLFLYFIRGVLYHLITEFVPFFTLYYIFCTVYGHHCHITLYWIFVLYYSHHITLYWIFVLYYYICTVLMVSYVTLFTIWCPFSPRCSVYWLRVPVSSSSPIRVSRISLRIAQRSAITLHCSPLQSPLLSDHCLALGTSSLVEVIQAILAWTI